jgi:hypothetical protein
MAIKNAQQLREAAKIYRGMCARDGDPALKAALMLLADDFEREAKILDARQNSDGTVDPLAP